MTIISETPEIMAAMIDEIRRTPGEALLEGGGEAVWLGDYARSADGRCAISHPFPEVVEDWIRAYCEGYPTPGAITFLESGLPADWKANDPRLSALPPR